MKRLQWILIVVIITIFTSCIKSEPIPEGQSGMYGDSPKGMSRPAGMTADGEGKQRTGSAERKSRAPDEVRDSGAGESGLGNNEEKSVTGKVKMIVGNEATLIITTGDGVETAESYLLPVGMRIGGKDFSSVTAGNTLKITFGTHPDDGSEIITAVSIVGGK